MVYSCNNSTENSVKSTDKLELILNSIRDSISKYPDNPKPKYNLAIVLQDAGRYKEAVLALDSMNLLKGDTADPRLYFDYLFKRAELLEFAGDTTEAIKTLELFVAPGELTQAGIRLANLYAETKNPKTIFFTEEMKKNDSSGNDPYPAYFKGIYYYNTEELDKALVYFDESIRKDYNFMEAYLEKGTILYKQKKYNAALKTLDLSLKVSGSFSDAYFWKAKCEEALGLIPEAKLNYQRAYGLDNTLTEAKERAEKL
jgi:tetratricopeptide (TPR) repeat protein